MNRTQRAALIARQLNDRYPEPGIPLMHRDPFTLLIAVVLSAQCTDARVNQVTPRLFRRARSPEAMARLDPAEIEAIIRPCGLAPRKSRAIQALASILVDKFGAMVPRDFAALESLPGVGHKTASVVMAQAFGVPAFPVDTHVHRLARRWRLSSAKNVVQTEKDLKRLFRPEEWNRLHLQMIYYGREHCTARGCDGRSCPICQACFPRPLSRGAKRKRRGSG
jgi:endonuclease-3